jgi:NAD(P)-dependent dehydrogenase (short-subunit alcohol dehydrogenase family)
MEKIIPSEIISKLFSVENKVVLITGAGGLGRVYARAFSKNGSKIVVASRSQANLDLIKKEIGSQNCSCHIMNVEDRSQVDDVIGKIELEFGRIDVLIHTVAIAPLGPTLNFDDDALKQTMDVNFIGSVYVNAAVGKIMARNGWGRIININSIDAFSVNCIDDLPYAASKAAMMSSTRHFAVELAQTGVTVNGIAPVWIWTPMMERRPADYMIQAAKTIPMGRISYSEDYIGIAFFLASDASGYVTGQTFLIDGGWSAYRAFKYSECL